MKRLILTLGIILIFSTSANAGQQFHFMWMAPTSYTDGSPVVNPNVEIGGYKLYIANASMGYNQPAFATIIGNIEFVDVTLPLGTWYVVLTAYTPYAVESDFSTPEMIVISDTSPVIKVVPMPPILRLN